MVNIYMSMSKYLRYIHLVCTHVQYTQTDTNRQETLTNGTIGKNHHPLKKPYNLHHWYKWKSPQSIGIPFVNCISLVPLEPIAPYQWKRRQRIGVPFVNCIYLHLRTARKLFVDWYHWQPIGASFVNCVRNASPKALNAMLLFVLKVC